MQEKNIYIEFLTVGRLWHLMKTDSRGRQISYFDASHGLEIFLPAMNLFFGTRVKKLLFHATEVKDHDQAAVFLRLLYQDVGQLQEKITADAEFKKFIVDAGVNDLEQLYLVKASVCFYDFRGEARFKEIWHALHLVQICRWHHQHQAGTVVLYINQRPWFNHLAAYAQQNGVTLMNHGLMDLLEFKWNGLCRKLRKLNWPMAKRICCHKIEDVVGRLKRDQPSAFAPGHKALLWMEHWGHFNFDAPQQQSDEFFVQPQGIRPSDLLISFNLSSDPIDQNKLAILQAQGAVAVALTPQASAVKESSVPVFRSRANHPEPLVTGLKKSQEQQCLFDLSRSYASEKNYWREFIRRYAVKIYLSWYKYEANHIAIADVLRDEGGVSAIYQRAYEPNSSPQVTIGADCIFGFAPGGYSIEKGNQSNFKYHVAVGYIGDYRFAHIKDIALGLRQQLRGAGARQVLAYLDENTTDDFRWFIGHEHARENYRFWLEKIFTNPQLGIIFKPKSPYDLRRRLGPVANLLSQAEATGRCVVLGGGALQGSNPPAAAALAADIAIHECLSAGTAGLESALAGVPTLLVDLDGWPRSPLYQLGKDVVFKDWDSTWLACQEFFNNPSSRARLGNWSGHIKELDPFNDGKAALRMSQFLKWILEDLRKGTKREEAMADAVTRYTKLWGKDKVHEG